MQFVVFALIDGIHKASVADARLEKLANDHIRNCRFGEGSMDQLMRLLLGYLPPMSDRAAITLAGQVTMVSRRMHKRFGGGGGFPELIAEWIECYREALQLSDLREALLSPEWWPACFASWLLAERSSAPEVAFRSMLACHAADLGEQASEALLYALLADRNPLETILQLLQQGVVSRPDVGDGTRLLEFVRKHTELDEFVAAYRASNARCSLTHWHKDAPPPPQAPAAKSETASGLTRGPAPRAMPRARKAKEEPEMVEAKPEQAPGPTIYRNQMPTRLRPARAHAVSILTVLWNRKFTGGKLLEERGLRQGVIGKLGRENFNEQHYSDALAWCREEELVHGRMTGVALNHAPPSTRSKRILERLKKP